VKLLLTGGNGQLGTELYETATAAGHEVRTTDRADCDITDPARVRQVLAETAPDALVNCAAWTRVDAAEADADDAFRINALGARVLASACAARSVLIVHLSTDYIFGGDATTPIDEWQPAHPRSVYGASKLAGEVEVRNVAPRHKIVRTSWLYGRDGPNFVLAMLRARQQGGALRVVSDQVSSPTWTGHLAPALLRLIARDLPGTYHLSNSGAVSWHGFAEAIFAAAGGSPGVTAIPTSEYPAAAVRPAYSVLDNRVWRLLGEAPLPHWRDALHEYLHRLRAQGMLGA
jgi:dTDP-4-dehydrorhamnose reductase